MTTATLSASTLRLAVRCALRASLLPNASDPTIFDRWRRNTSLWPRSYSAVDKQRIVDLHRNLSLKSLSGQWLPTTPEEWNHYHARLVVAPASMPGRHRKKGVRTGCYHPPPGDEVSQLMDGLVARLNHPRQHYLPAAASGILRAILTHFQLLSIHPYADGNGLVARAAEFATLLNAGLPTTLALSLTQYYYANRFEYCRRLNASQQSGDPETFVDFALKGLDACLQQQLVAWLDQGGMTRRQMLRAGFTLVELLIVVLILGIVGGVVVPKLVNNYNDALRASELQTVESIWSSIDMYRAMNGDFPLKLDDARTNAACSGGNPCFTNILRTALRNGKWKKLAAMIYRGPAGGIYQYFPGEGDFIEIEDYRGTDEATVPTTEGEA